MLWPSLRAWFQGGTPYSDRTQRSARQIAIPEGYDRSCKEPAVKNEQDSIEFQAICRRRLIEIPRQSNVREDTIIVLGAGGVGKIELIYRFLNGYTTDSNYIIECSYLRHITVDGQTTVLNILDTTGTEQFTSLDEFYIKAGRGFVLVFSLTQQNSLLEVCSLREQIYRVKGTKDVPIVIVGNNSDLTEEREVQREVLVQLSTLWETPIYETSVRKNWHVTDVFEDLVRQLRIQYPSDPPKRRSRRRRHLW